MIESRVLGDPTLESPFVNINDNNRKFSSANVDTEHSDKIPIKASLRSNLVRRLGQNN